MFRQGVGVAGVLILLGVSGCGTSSSLTSAQFVRRANAVCNKAHRLAEKRGSGLEGYVEAAVASQTMKLNGISLLQPPNELRLGYTQYTHVLRIRSRLFKRYLSIVRAHQPLHVDAARAAELQVSEKRLAARLQLSRC
jgi:hypothetical protein